MAKAQRVESIPDHFTEEGIPDHFVQFNGSSVKVTATPSTLDALYELQIRKRMRADLGRRLEQADRDAAILEDAYHAAVNAEGDALSDFVLALERETNA